MNLSQKKLSKSEWNAMEIPVSHDEQNIIKMIIHGYHDPTYTYNSTQTLSSFLKIKNTESNANYMFHHYLKEKLEKYFTKYGVQIDIPTAIEKKKMNKVDLMRIENNNKSTFKTECDHIYEFKLIEMIGKLLKYKHANNYKWCVHYYTLSHIVNYNIHQVNPFMIKIVNYLIDTYKDDIEKRAIIAKGKEYIENNDALLKYAPNKLYSHQRDIFSVFNHKREHSNMVLYIAPTATGKTLTPIALSESHRIIFVCAARHVGVALARSAISVGKKVAFAFGCETADDIRLHYFAAKTYDKNKRTGAIAKVDNSDGVNVEIMICDIKSYLCAMYYMASFNQELNQTNNDLILFWDEPTITMDYESHECHEYISKNWRDNIIPNIVLSSATLPSEEELEDTISDFRMRFDNSLVTTVCSAECKKTIRLCDSKGNIVLPHLQYGSYEQMQESVQFCLKNKTLYRYLDLEAICKFVILIQEVNDYQLPEYLDVDTYFDDINAITMESVKEFYLTILSKMSESDYHIIHEHFKEEVVGFPKNHHWPQQSNGVNITTCDAYTLTDGPTIYIAENVEKIATYCVHQSKIPQSVIARIHNDIRFNNKINNEIIKLNKALEDKLQKDIDAGNEKKIQKDSKDPEVKELMKKIRELNGVYKEISIDASYIPNSLHHLMKWYDDTCKNAFTSNITANDVQRIMAISNIDDIWKILLLMGIGLFSKDHPLEYIEIVKEFADTQKLYLIIANGDYIYGTNYQFCHAFVGKDLENMTQEKIIQAMGRVGRNKLQQTYSIRLRSDKLIDTILLQEHDKIEVKNMNVLFSIPHD